MRTSSRCLLPASLLCALTGGLVTLTAACASLDRPAGATPAAGPTADQAFLAAAASEGLAEVRYAELAEERSRNPEVRTFARTLLDDYRTTNAAIREAAAAKGIALPTDLDQVEKRDLWQLGRLYTYEFDRYYVNMVAEYHIHGVRQLRRELRHTADPDLRALAHGVMKIVERDRDLAQSLIPHYGFGRTYGGDTPQ